MFKGKNGYSKFEVESSAFLSEMKSLISKFEVENGHNPIFQNFDLWLKTSIGILMNLARDLSDYFQFFGRKLHIVIFLALSKAFSAGLKAFP